MRIKKKGLKKLLASALALMMCLGMTLTTMAGVGTPAAPAVAVLRKTVRFAATLTSPAADFTFEFEKVGKDGIADSATLVPTIDDVVLSFTQGETDTAVDGVINISKESANLLTGLTWESDDADEYAGDGAGVYVWRVTETQSGATIDAATGEAMDYSQAMYLLIVTVAYDETTESYYVQRTEMVTEEDHTGETVELTDGKGDVDPDDGAGGENPSFGFEFINIFSKQGGEDPGVPATNEALVVSKEVTGSIVETTRDFSFVISLNDSVAKHTPATYVGTIYDAADAVVGTVSVTASGDVDDVVAFTLKHEQRLVFTDVPVGTKVTITETGTIGYVPSVSGMVTADAAVGEDLTTAVQTIALGENRLDFVNNYTGGTVETGLVANYLPFIALIGLAVLVVASFAVINRRKAMR